MTPTHFHIQTETFSFLDLSIVSSGCLIDFDHRVLLLENLSVSDHYPTLFSKTNRPGIIQYSDKFKTDLADWTSFKLLTRDFSIAPVDDIDDTVKNLYSFIMHAAKSSIPISPVPL